MNAVPESTIPLTESETQFLKRALLEAKEQAARSTPKTESDTAQAVKKPDTEARPNAGGETNWETTTFIL